MNIFTVTRVFICAALVTGCVSSGTHEKTLAELADARKTLESSKKQAAAEADRLQKQLLMLNTRVAGAHERDDDGPRRELSRFRSAPVNSKARRRAPNIWSRSSRREIRISTNGSRPKRRQGSPGAGARCQGAEIQQQARTAQKPKRRTRLA